MHNMLYKFKKTVKASLTKKYQREKYWNGESSFCKLFWIIGLGYLQIPGFSNSASFIQLSKIYGIEWLPPTGHGKYDHISTHK